MIKIKIIDSQKPDQVQEIDLQPGTMLNQACLIGRAPNSHLFLDSNEVSRMHGKIALKDGNYYFADLGSAGGSRINGGNASVNQDHLLKPGDMIHVGKFFLMVLQVGSPESRKETVAQVGLHEKTVIEFIEPVSDSPQHDVVELASPLKVPEISPQQQKVVSPQEYMPLAMVEPSQVQRWIKGDLTVQCVSIIDETQDVKTFRFVADPPVLFTYKPGQFVTLDLEINNEQVSRSYSISSTPSRPHTLEITVKRVPPPPNSLAEVPKGMVSNWLHDNITVGSTINLSGPLGKFTCFANPSQKLLLISAGSGITPMMSMSRWLCDTGSHCDIVFFHSARSPRDIIFRHELELMSAQHPNFHLAVSTTRKEIGHSWLSLTGRISAAMLEVVVPDFRERTVYVCGPDTFMQGVKELLESINFPMQNYYEESFGPPAKKSKSEKPKQQVAAPSKPTTPPPPAPQGLKELMRNMSPDTTPKSNGGRATPVSTPTQSTPAPTVSSSSKTAVLFAKSSKEVPCDGEESILSLAEQEGVKIRSSCRSGVCGSCKKRKIQGEIRLEGEPEALEESDHQEGYILTCISFPVGRVEIDA